MTTSILNVLIVIIIIIILLLSSPLLSMYFQGSNAYTREAGWAIP
jgi:hypothetical protein